MIENFKSDILSFPSLHKPSLQCLRPCRSIFLHPQIHSRHPCPNQIQNCCPKTPSHHGLDSEILQAKRERSRLERCWRRWKSPFDRMKFRAQCRLCQIPHFQSQVLIFVQSCNRIICTIPAHSGKPSTQFFIENLQTHFQSPQMHHPLPTHSLIFSYRQNWTHPHQICTIWFSWSVSFSNCPTSKDDQFYSSHSHWNSQTHFCFWK